MVRNLPDTCLLLALIMLCGIYPASAGTGHESFFEKTILVDVFGLGTFHGTSYGNFASLVRENSYPPGHRLPPELNAQNSPQLSGRPGWGGGIAVTAMASRHLGISADHALFARSEGSRLMTAADYAYARMQTSLAAIVKFPIATLHSSPYVLAGAGAQYGNWPDISIPGGPSRRPLRYTLAGQGFVQLGAGWELWLSGKWGVFCDARWLRSAVQGLPKNQAQLRYGLRMSF